MASAFHESDPRSVQRLELMGALSTEFLGSLGFAYREGVIPLYSGEDIAREVDTFLEVVSRSLPDQIEHYRDRQEYVDRAIDRLLSNEEKEGDL